MRSTTCIELLPRPHHNHHILSIISSHYAVKTTATAQNCTQLAFDDWAAAADDGEAAAGCVVVALDWLLKIIELTLLWSIAVAYCENVKKQKLTLRPKQNLPIPWKRPPPWEPLPVAEQSYSSRHRRAVATIPQLSFCPS